MNLKDYKTGIIIQARTGSKRFPRKILVSIYKKKIIEIMIERLLICFKPQDIYIATTDNKKDEIIIKHLKKYKINFFQGSENNLLKRFIDCAKIFRLNTVIRLTADCPLIDPYLIKDFFNYQLNKNLDYYSNCAPYVERTFPVGSDIEFFKVKTLKKILISKPNKYEKEHIIGAINIPAYKDRGNSDYGAVDRIVGEFKKIEEQNPDTEFIVYCYSTPCMTGRKVGAILTENEIYVKHLGIGWNEWRYFWTMWNHEHEWNITNVEDYMSQYTYLNYGDNLTDNMVKYYKSMRTR